MEKTANTEGIAKRQNVSVRGGSAVRALRPLAWFAGTVFGFLLPAPSSHLNVFRIYVVGLGFATIFLFSAGYIIPGGSSTFTLWAEALVNGSTLDPGVAQRDIGFPLMLLLSGYPFTGSLIGITLIHTAFAILMSILVYFALRPFSPGIAYYSGQAGTLCLGSFQFVKMIHHDQTYIFFTVLMAAWMSLFFARGAYKYLYLFTIACLAASISRPAGNLLFPLFLLLAFVAGTRPRMIRHYAACVLIFALATAAYQWHRYEIFDVRHQPSIPSYTGQQVFYNLYLNSREYGITLGPEVGPHMQELDTALREALGPVPQEGKFLWAHAENVPKAFAASELLPFTRDQLMRQIYLLPNWEYYTLFCDAEPNDQKILAAALEIIQVHPIYFIEYSLRNTLVFLFHPGFAHTRYTINPFGPISLQFYPPLAGIGEGENLAPRAMREARLNMLAAEPHFVRSRLARTEYSLTKLWQAHYQDFVTATAFLMVLAWLTLGLMGACAIGRWRGRDRIGDAIALWFQPGFIGALLATSMLLLYNAGVTAAFAEPDYRYHHFILLLRVLAAGFGAVILLRMISVPARAVRESLVWLDLEAPWAYLRRARRTVSSYDAVEIYLADRPNISVIILSVATIVAFAGWAVFMVRHTA